MNTYITKKRDKTTPLVTYRHWGVLPPLVHRTKFPPLGGGTPLMSVGRTLSNVCETRVAHQRSVVLIRVASDDEIGFIIKAALAFAAKTESVLTPFHREGRNFITSSIVFFVVTGENTLCGQVPVVLGGGGSSQVHRSSHCLCVWWELSSVEYQKKHFNFLQFTYNPHRSRKK